CQLRKAALQRRDLAAKAAGGGKSPRLMTVAELAAAAGSERGPRLKVVLAELGGRQGDKAVAALGSAAGAYEGDVRQAARDALAKNLARESAAALKRRLQDDRAEIRGAAARAVAG